MNEIVLAVDLGGTNIRMASVSPDGSIHHLARRKTPENVSPAELVDLTELLARECADHAPENALVKGIAFGSPAPAARNSGGVLTQLPNLPSLNGMNLAAALRERFSLPVTLENDATAAAIGENWLGTSRKVQNSVIVTLGTGVGGGLIIDGEPYRGIDGTAGEIGHICVEPDGHPCGCGSRGCVEQYASATAIVRMGKEFGLRFDTAHEIYIAAGNGDEAAQKVYKTMGKYLGITLAGLINVFNPEMIVIGGGMAAGWEAFIGPLKAEVSERAFNTPASRAKVVRSSLGDNAGLLGVARSAFLSQAQHH
ncbi:ROK family protein [soil metagenome]